jgi:hypothetical protein
MDLQEAFDAGFEAVKAYVDDALASFDRRLREIEVRPLAKDGIGIADAIKNADGVLMLTLSDGRVLNTAVRDGIDGTALSVDDMRPLIVEHVNAAVSEIEQTASALVEKAIDAAVEKIVPPEVPKPVELPDVAGMVRDAVAAIPRPVDGKDADMQEMAKLVDAAVTKAVAALPAPKDGKDGIGLAGGMIARDGNLVLTLSDGTTRDLGIVVGRNGEPGKDGNPGRDGTDGLGFDDLEFTVSDDGAFLTFVRGEAKKTFRLPIVIDRGVWRERGAFRAGDAVTWAGNYYIAQRDTTSRPDGPNSDWRLAVKKGRDGKDAAPPKPVKA